MYSKNQKNKIYISYHTEFFVKMLKNQQVSNVLSDNDYTVIMLSKSYLFFLQESSYKVWINYKKNYNAETNKKI